MDDSFGSRRNSLQVKVRSTSVTQQEYTYATDKVNNSIKRQAGNLSIDTGKQNNSYEKTPTPLVLNKGFSAGAASGTSPNPRTKRRA